MKKLFIILLFLFFISHINCINGQNTYKVSGTIINNKDKLPLPGANIILKSKSLGNSLPGTVSDTEGQFEFKNLSPARYKIVISYIGFMSDSSFIIVKDTDIKLKPIMLKEDLELLKEFEVKSVQTRVEIKGDTLEHKADAYKTHPDASAEDLIKKLPGVTTEGNTVKVDGEEVKKVLVDGKPFFSDDPTATLRNLPAEIVDNIQMFDFQSEQSQFTGFRDGNEEKTINLNTKKGMNIGQFGKVYMAYGPDDKYNAGFTLNSFNSSQRISIIGMSNNINQQNFNISDIMSVMSNSSEQGGGRTDRGRGRGSASDFFSSQQGGITNTNALGLNYNDRWGKKIKVSASYFFNQTKNNNESSISRNYFTQNNLQYNENSSSTTDNLNHKLNMKLEYVIDSLNKIILTPRLTFQKNNKKSTLKGINTVPDYNELISETENNSTSENTGINFYNDLLYQHKFKKKGRTVSLNINTQINNRNGNGSNYSESIYSDTLAQNAPIDRTYLSESKSTILGANLTYTEPLWANTQLMFTYRPTYKINDADIITNAADSSTNYVLMDTLLSNVFKNTYMSHRGGISYGLNTSKANLTLGADIEQAVLYGTQTFPAQLNVKKLFNKILPSAYYNYKFSKTFNLYTNFRSSTREPGISQLQNLVDMSNPIFVKTGNPQLKQSFENRFSFRLTKRIPEKESHFMVFVMARQTNDYISNATYFLTQDTSIQNVIINKGSQLTIPVNLDKYYNIRSFGVLGIPLSKIKSNLNLNAAYTFTQTPALINSSINYSRNNSINAGFYLSSNISPYFDFSISYNGGYNMVNNTLQTQSNNTYFNHSASVKVNTIFFKKLVLNTDISQKYYTGLTESYNQSFTLWNAFVGYKFAKNQSFELKVSVNDILNQNTSISHSITETYTEDSRTETLNRYALLTLTYTFRNFKNGVRGPEEFKIPKGMPPPGSLPPPGGGPPPN